MDKNDGRDDGDLPLFGGPADDAGQKPCQRCKKRPRKEGRASCEPCLKILAAKSRKDRLENGTSRAPAERERNWRKVTCGARWVNGSALRYQHFDKVLRAFGSLCAACRRSDSGHKTHKNGGSLGVDHRPKVGPIRGVLCTNCNSADAKTKHNERISVALAAYQAVYNFAERAPLEVDFTDRGRKTRELERRLATVLDQWLAEQRP